MNELMFLKQRPVSDSSYLHIVDAETRKVVDEYLKAQDSGQACLKISNSNTSFSLTSKMSAAQLNKLRRQFMTYVKMHPATKQEEVGSSFLQFISSNTE